MSPGLACLTLPSGLSSRLFLSPCLLDSVSAFVFGIFSRRFLYFSLSLAPSLSLFSALSLSSAPLDFTFMILIFRFYFSVYWLFIAVYFVGPNRPETGFGSINFVFLYSCILVFYVVFDIVDLPANQSDSTGRSRKLHGPFTYVNVVFDIVDLPANQSDSSRRGKKLKRYRVLTNQRRLYTCRI